MKKNAFCCKIYLTAVISWFILMKERNREVTTMTDLIALKNKLTKALEDNQNKREAEAVRGYDVNPYRDLLDRKLEASLKQIEKLEDSLVSAERLSKQLEVSNETSIRTFFSSANPDMWHHAKELIQAQGIDQAAKTLDAELRNTLTPEGYYFTAKSIHRAIEHIKFMDDFANGIY